ncbi:glycerol kinase GlpK [soil metagenome]
MSILSIDAGTTGVTALVVGEAGRALGKGYREFPQAFPRPGWVEHDPGHWRSATLGACREACAAAAIEPGRLAAIGITNQRETTVLWDRTTLRPVHPAIVWQDRRTAPLCDVLREEGWEAAVHQRTGLVIDPYFSATKVAWLLENVPGAREDAEAGRLAFGTVDSYLLAWLTGGAVHATDRTNASRTMLFDISRLAWDDELLDRLRIPRALLPAVVPSWGELGTTAGDWPASGIPITGVAGDQQAALFGQACIEPGATKNTYGTGSFVLMHTGEAASMSPTLLTTLACSDEGSRAYALEGSIFVSGAALQWLRDGLSLLERTDQAGPIAESVADTGGVYFVPALTGLGAPWWDAYARGTLVGLTRGTGRAHVVRAAVEAMAYQTRDVVDAMCRDAGISITELRADGGASAMDFLLQFQADLLGVPVVRPVIPETTALGAAYLAGLGRGIWSSPAETASLWRADAEFLPRGGPDLEGRYGGWRRAVERSLRWALPETQ